MWVNDNWFFAEEFRKLRTNLNLYNNRKKKNEQNFLKEIIERFSNAPVLLN